jgi:hypothetical protein
MLDKLKKDYSKAKRSRLHAFNHGVQNHPAVRAAEAIPGNGSRVSQHDAVAQGSHSDPNCSECVEDMIWNKTAPSKTVEALSAAKDVVKSRLKGN